MNQITINSLIQLRQYFKIKIHKIKSDSTIIEMLDYCIDNAKLVDELPIFFVNSKIFEIYFYVIKTKN